MKFDTPATQNPIDQLKIVGHATDRIEGPLKTTGAATYAYEHRDLPSPPAYGFVLGAAIAKGRIRSIDAADAERAPGVLAVVTAANAGAIEKGTFYVARALAGPQVDHYHQAAAVVVAETFEQARAAAHLVRVDYARAGGAYDLSAVKADAALREGNPATGKGDFAGAFAAAPVTVDATYHTPDQAHAMMEPHATIASWDGDRLTLRTSMQMVSLGLKDVMKTFGLSRENIRIITPYVGGGFGGKSTILSDAVLAALAARTIGRPVKVTLQRDLLFNNTTHRPATIQRVRLGATKAGRITAIGHESWCGNLPGGFLEDGVIPTRLLYAGANRMASARIGLLDLPEGSAMRAPGEAPGMMALEIAVDELAEKLDTDPVALRILNDTQVDPEKPDRPFSKRQYVECLRRGADRFGWSARTAPASRRDGRWLVGMGMASAIRGAPVQKSGARVRLDANGIVTVETDMTDIGTGSYTIIAQTAAEMMGVPLDRVVAKLGDSDFPESAGSGGQWGAASATAGVYAACVKLREAVAQRLGFNGTDVAFADGRVRSGNRSVALADAARQGELVAEDFIEFGDLDKTYEQQTFGAHFVEVGVDAYTGAVRIRRMLAVCAAGRILNPKSARSQVIGGMTMGAGAALMEELAVDKRFGFFVNHDLASYEVPVHADIPYQEVIFLDEVDPYNSPMKAKGVGELGISGVAPAIANAIFNATGVRVREYPITLDKLIGKMPAVA